MTHSRPTHPMLDAAGQTMTEYAFILALVFAVVVVTVPMIGTSVSAFFTTFVGAF